MGIPRRRSRIGAKRAHVERPLPGACHVGRVVVALAALVLVGAGPWAPSARAATVTLEPLRDTTIYSESGTVGNGAGDYVFAGATNNLYKRRALLVFDVAAVLPAGATIDAVTLSLHLSRTTAGPVTVAVHRVLAEWGEGTSNANLQEGQGAAATAGDATWTNRLHPTDAWTTAGGDYVGTASATTSVGLTQTTYTWSSAGLASDVQGWLDGTLPAYGWIVVGGEAMGGTSKRFDSRENPDDTRRPKLTIDYTAPTATATPTATETPTPTATATPTPTETVVPTTTATETPPPDATATPSVTPTVTETATPTASPSATATPTATVTTTGTPTPTNTPTPTATASPLVLAPFVDPLPLPAVAAPISGTAGGAASYRLAIREVQQQLHRDLPPTTVWGFGDGAAGATYPGPTIEATRDQPISVTWVNDLRENGVLRTMHYLPVDTCLHGAHHASPRAVVHLHGGHVPAASDGYPEATILPGEETTYAYPNAQLPGTLWYHDHALGITRLNVYMGLAGFYLLRDATEAALDLPAGAFEIPLAIQDRTLAPDGSLVYPDMWHEHFFGDVILVNGKVWPYLTVQRGKYRFRVLDGSTSRTYRLTLSNGAPFVVIGSDGGLLPAPVTVDALTLQPGERADVVIDFAAYAPGTEIVLTNDAPAPYPGVAGQGVVPNVMKFVVGSEAGHTAPIPATLRPFTPIDESEATVSRQFLLRKSADPCTGSVWLINDMHWDEITERPQLGTTEVWSFVNPTGMAHPMHMHLVMFQVLDRQPFELQAGNVMTTGPRVPPVPVEAGWKDTVRVEPGEIVRVIARFTDYKGRFPYHCHILEHEDHDMMRQFETVACGDGEIDPGEECDDGNRVDGDGCTAGCLLGPCTAAPAVGCAAAGSKKGSLTLRVKPGVPAKNALAWKWSKGAAIAKTDFGDPTTTESYHLCVYDAGALVLATRAEAAGTCGKKPCWKSTKSGYTFNDKELTPAGVATLGLKSGAVGKGVLQLRAKGANLALPALDGLAGPVLVQLKRGSGGACWSTTFTAPFKKHDAKAFRDASD